MTFVYDYLLIAGILWILSWSITIITTYFNPEFANEMLNNPDEIAILPRLFIMSLIWIISIWPIMYYLLQDGFDMFVEHRLEKVKLERIEKQRKKEEEERKNQYKLERKEDENKDKLRDDNIKMLLKSISKVKVDED